MDVLLPQKMIYCVSIVFFVVISRNKFALIIIRNRIILKIVQLWHLMHDKNVIIDGDNKGANFPDTTMSLQLSNVENLFSSKEIIGR